MSLRNLRERLQSCHVMENRAWLSRQTGPGLQKKTKPENCMPAKLELLLASASVRVSRASQYGSPSGFSRRLLCHTYGCPAKVAEPTAKPQRHGWRHEQRDA